MGDRVRGDRDLIVTSSARPPFGKVGIWTDVLVLLALIALPPQEPFDFARAPGSHRT
jgi:hypothetical protein